MTGNIILFMSVNVRLKTTFTVYLFGRKAVRRLRSRRPTNRNIIPGVFSIKKFKPGVAKTVAKRGGSTSSK